MHSEKWWEWSNYPITEALGQKLWPKLDKTKLSSLDPGPGAALWPCWVGNGTKGKWTQGNKIAGRQELPPIGSMIHAKSCTRTFGLENSSNQHTAAMAQRCEFSTVTGGKKNYMVQEKRVCTVQIKAIVITKYLLQVTTEIHLLLNLMTPVCYCATEAMRSQGC